MNRQIVNEMFKGHDFSEDMIAAMLSIAAIKASIYGDGVLSDEALADFIQYEIIRCLKGYNPEDPETKEALEAGVDEESIIHCADIDRRKLIQQAEWIAFALNKLKD